MTIETKFNVGDTVFFLSRQHLDIRQTKIKAFYQLDDKKRVRWTLEAKEFEYPGFEMEITRDETQIFFTKEDCLKSL